MASASKIPLPYKGGGALIHSSSAVSFGRLSNELVSNRKNIRDKLNNFIVDKYTVKQNLNQYLIDKFTQENNQNGNGGSEQN